MNLSMSIHDVIDIEVEDTVVDVKDVGPMDITHYYFHTKDGSRVDIGVFHAREEENES